METMVAHSYQGMQVRTAQIGGEVWWVLKDVCDVLGIGNTSMVAERLDDDEKMVVDLNTFRQSESIRGNPNMTVVNESGLYNVVLRSDKPEAKKFKRWITHEVLPQIRRTGGYIPAAATDTEEEIIAKAWVIANRTLENQKKRLAALEEQTETLEIALNMSLQYYTVAKYNRERNMNWGMRECKQIGKQLTAYCRANSISVRKCETNDERFGVVNSYPLTAWESMLAGRA